MVSLVSAERLEATTAAPASPSELELPVRAAAHVHCVKGAGAD